MRLGQTQGGGVVLIIWMKVCIVRETLGGTASVVGAQGDAKPVHAVRLAMRTVTTTGKPLLFEVPGRSYYMEGVNSTILAFTDVLGSYQLTVRERPMVNPIIRCSAAYLLPQTTHAPLGVNCFF